MCEVQCFIKEAWQVGKKIDKWQKKTWQVTEVGTCAHALAKNSSFFKTLYPSFVWCSFWEKIIFIFPDYLKLSQSHLWRQARCLKCKSTNLTLGHIWHLVIFVFHSLGTWSMVSWNSGNTLGTLSIWHVVPLALGPLGTHLGIQSAWHTIHMALGPFSTQFTEN